jgi:RND family efflux transporter MFP subunit
VLLLVAVAVYWRASSATVVEVAIAQPAGGAGGAGGAAAVLNASGYVIARRLATVSSKVTGKVVEVLVEEGMSVKRGQMLARLDDSTVRAQFDYAAAQWESAQKNLAEVKVRRAEAQRQQQRFEALKARNLVSESALDTAQSDVAALEARLVALQAEVDVAANGRRLRSRDLEDLAVRAPFDGVVTSKDAQPGEMVSPISAGGGFTRTGIATVVDMESREIEVDVNEAYINRVRAGQRTEAVLDAYPDWTIASHVINIVPTADRQKATVRVRIAFDALDPRILPEMGIKVRFLDEPTGAGAGAGGGSNAGSTGRGPGTGGNGTITARIPAATIVRDGTQDVVWVVKGNVLERRAVRVGAGQGELRDVLAGVAAGETLVANPSAELREGQRVKVKETAP